jgi:hypothetical protein
MPYEQQGSKCMKANPPKRHPLLSPHHPFSHLFSRFQDVVLAGATEGAHPLPLLPPHLLTPPLSRDYIRMFVCTFQYEFNVFLHLRTYRRAQFFARHRWPVLQMQVPFETHTRTN